MLKKVVGGGQHHPSNSHDHNSDTKPSAAAASCDNRHNHRSKPVVAPPTTRNMSHGRGGAGNFKAPPKDGQAEAKDLATPTIKSSTYTTGRGGQGNMAKLDKDKPEIARMAQDVEAPLYHEKETQGTYHWGRGGEGNMLTVGKSGADEARERSQTRKAEKAKDPGLAEKRRTGSFTGAIGKGREALGLGKKTEKADKTDKVENKDAAATSAPASNAVESAVDDN